MKSKKKKKVLSIYIGNVETYTRYSRVADEKSSYGAIAFLNSRDLKKEFGKPCFRLIIQNLL